MKSAVIFLGILIPALSVFNIISALKKGRKSPVVLNGIFYGIIVLLIVLSGVNKAVRAKASENYNIYGGGFLGSVKYVGTEDGYIIIKRTGIMIDDDIAVPARNAHISFLTKIYKPAIIYCRKGTELYSSETTVNSKKYKLGGTVEKIKPDFGNMILLIGLADIFVTAIFNLILAIYNGVRRENNSLQIKK